MIIKLLMPDKTLKDFDIPDFVAEKYESDVEVHYSEDAYPSFGFVQNWCHRVGINLVATY